MAQPFPYTYYACGCSEIKHTSVSKRSSQQPNPDEDEVTFDPRNPRSAYSLYPLTHLLYCEDCRQIRCPRCVTEEVQAWFCPSCLFEVGSTSIKEGNIRCTRSCSNCPVCTTPMTVNSLADPREGERGSEGGRSTNADGPFVLSCPYCRWSTCETGIEFEKASNINLQLAKIGNGGTSIPSGKEREKERERLKEKEKKRYQDIAMGRGESTTAAADEDDDDTSQKEGEAELTHDALFSNLSSFYKSQLAAQTPTNPFSTHDISFSSPSSFSRIMNLYSTTSTSRSGQKRQKPTPMREASSALEGLIPHSPSTDAEGIERIRKDGWSCTLSPSQKISQEYARNPSARFDTDLRPIATLLQTKRGKRCTTCRHILSKPEQKITSTRYKIKLLALNHIPRLSIRYLPPPPTSSSTPAIAILPPLQGGPTQPAANTDPTTLRPGLPTHFLLHLSNPLFDPIRVTLATPSITPGRVQSRVTILCPQFEVGANTDVWDDALASSTSITPRSGSLSEGMESLMEAGKVWEKGRNWTSVAVEVVPGFLGDLGRVFGGGTPKKSRKAGGYLGTDGGGGAGGGSGNTKRRSVGGGMEAQLDFSPEDSEDEGFGEDDDVLEIPIFVRIEYETDVQAESGAGGGAGDQREKREEAFWTVVGVGRIKDS